MYSCSQAAFAVGIVDVDENNYTPKRRKVKDEIPHSCINIVKNLNNKQI